MRICYLLASTGEWGGLEKHTFDVANAMAERGHAVSVLCDRSYQGRGIDTVAVVPFDWSGARRNPLCWYRLRRAINDLEPDVVHAQADKAAYILSKSGWPKSSVAIGTVHNVKSSYGSYKKLDRLIAVSGAIASQLSDFDVTVVHNGVDVSSANAQRVQMIKASLDNGRRPVFLAVGRLVEAKGFDVLLRAWPQNTKACLVILGDGKQRAELEELIESRGLQGVCIMGYSNEVQEWLNVTDFLVISSRNEGGPYVLSEALLSRVSVIGTRVGMVPDFLAGELMVEPNDVVALAGLLESVIDDPDRYRSACTPSFALAQAHLSQGAMMDAVESLYLSQV